VHAYPQACAAAADAQNILEGFPGCHLTPRRWLHITTLVAGSTAELARDQMSAMVAQAQHGSATWIPSL
jgi:hypothetical protein